MRRAIKHTVTFLVLALALASAPLSATSITALQSCATMQSQSHLGCMISSTGIEDLNSSNLYRCSVTLTGRFSTEVHAGLAVYQPTHKADCDFLIYSCVDTCPEVPDVCHPKNPDDCDPSPVIGDFDDAYLAALPPLIRPNFALTDAASGVLFDIFASGQKVMTPWTSPGGHKGFLILWHGDSNVNARNLLGDHTWPGAANGFAYLQLRDINGDLLITAADPVWSTLRFWFDGSNLAPRDGIAQPQELYGLSDLGITAIHLEHVRDGEQPDQFGNVPRWKSTADWTVGHLKLKVPLWDWVFRVSQP